MNRIELFKSIKKELDYDKLDQKSKDFIRNYINGLEVVPKLSTAIAYIKQNLKEPVPNLKESRSEPKESFNDFTKRMGFGHVTKENSDLPDCVQS